MADQTNRSPRPPDDGGFLWREVHDRPAGERPSPPITRPSTGMPTSVTDQLAAVIAQIDERRSADQWRLTMLKGWCGRPGRLTVLALLVAAHAACPASRPCLGGAPYDPRYGTGGLNQPSRRRLEELVDSIKHREAAEATAPEGARPMNTAP
jgi:hypothetical protein